MRTFLSTIRKVFTIEDFYTRLSNTLLFVAIYRAGTYILLPGIDHIKFTRDVTGILAWLDRLLGGSLATYSLFGLGITPYISASIVIQFATISIPYFQRLQKEGPAGRNKLNQITRLIALAVAPIQGIPYLYKIVGTNTLLMSKYYFIGISAVLLTTGTMFCIWLADRITEKGLGNGTSILITAGILSSLPSAIGIEINNIGTNNMLIFVIELVILFFIIQLLITFMQGIRRIPLQRARQTIGTYIPQKRRREYLPIKVNAAGVMPIIMASMISATPRVIGYLLRNKSEKAAWVEQIMSDVNGWHYNLFLSILIFFSTYLYIAVFINPTEIANNLKRENGFIPGIKPGNPTANYIDSILSKITLPSSLFLACIAIVPALAYYLGITKEFSKFFGGTSLLIVIGSILELAQQIESYLFMGYYDSMVTTDQIKL